MWHSLPCVSVGPSPPWPVTQHEGVKFPLAACVYVWEWNGVAFWSHKRLSYLIVFAFSSSVICPLWCAMPKTKNVCKWSRKIHPHTHTKKGWGRKLSVSLLPLHFLTLSSLHLGELRIALTKHNHLHQPLKIGYQDLMERSNINKTICMQELKE